MLSCRRVGRIRRVALQYRPSSTQAVKQDGPSASEPPPRLPASHPQLPYLLGQRSLVLRMVDNHYLESPLDAYAVVRAVEARFGRIFQFRFHRDAESNRFQFLAFLCFADPDAYTRVPKKGPNVVRAYVPAHLPPSGGIGLADLEKAGVLTPKDWTDGDLAEEVRAHYEGPKLQDGQRVIQFHVDHHIGSFQKVNKSPAGDYNLRNLREPLMASFVRWGGFAPMERIPVTPETRVTRAHLLCGGAPVDHPFMRYQLDAWSNSIPHPFLRVPLQPVTQHAVKIPPQESLHVAPNANAKASETIAINTVEAKQSPTADTKQPPIPQATPPPLKADTKPPAPQKIEPDAPRPERPTVANTTPQATRSKLEANAKHPAPEAARLERAQQAAGRTLMRAARGSSRKVDPVKAEAVKQEQGPKGQQQNAKAQRPQAKASQPVKGKKKQEKRKDMEKEKPVEKARESPIEVEERKAGIATRLKGIFGGWR
ncbi:hypothetical protein DFH07DRAFT_803733 [Mycena maculata]|uniref:Uncharacterized protein n=1 Tax=Mycena maculata TaxID=230809 RepID=A0AAD7NRP4_9AGAR|nr:hypothetical protein DFH07DRAFT_803733 [Mycena maculata]